MIRTLIKWVFIAVVAILTYNYFFGTETEKQQSEKVINKLKEAGSSLWDMLKDEKDRIQEGKYDDVIQNIQGAIDKLKASGQKAGDEFREIEKELENTREKVDELKRDTTTGQEEKKDSIEQKLRNILDKIQDLQGE